MTWANVKLIFNRETRDQMRDRRTLFTIAIMPLILYPLMGMAMLQVAQFTREHPARVWFIGEGNLPDSPSLLVDGGLDPQWLAGERASMLEICSSEEQDEKFHDLVEQFHNEQALQDGSEIVDQMIDRQMKARNIDLAIVVTKQRTKAGTDVNQSIYLFHNSASDRSKMAADRLYKVLSRWKAKVVDESLAESGVPLSLVHGIKISGSDIANKTNRQAATWSKILPFIVIIWALTGAFYPAIDLCAGEKERGTFETLLSSPAGRNEIAIGKLLTVMSFSIVTSLLNLASMAFTGLFVVSRMGGAIGMGASAFGIPPASALLWLLLALIPISALFSAIALAAAAFARSSKEGQYYLIPLMMISMPLMMVPMLPGASLDFGTSLIPVSGLMLLLRGLIEGQYSQVLPYAAPVCMVTITCCYLAIRWVVYQFNSESVLFRASEKFGVGAWLQHVMRERHKLPSVGNALLLGVLVLVLGFFVRLAVQSQPPGSWFDIVKVTLVVLIATTGIPAILMAMILTRDPLQSLRLRVCSVPAGCAAVLLAICLHPVLTWFTAGVMYVYPPAADMSQFGEYLNGLIAQAPGLWAVILVIAVAPAVFEELAFRGFILSGLEGLRNRWQAILISAILFGLAHAAIQQSIVTFVVGMVLGVIAVQTQSLIPCVLYHATHNSITVLLSKADRLTVESSPILPWFLYSSDGVAYQYAMIPALIATASGVFLLGWYLRNPAPQPTDGPKPDRVNGDATRLLQRAHG